MGRGFCAHPLPGAPPRPHGGARHHRPLKSHLNSKVSLRLLSLYFCRTEYQGKRTQAQQGNSCFGAVLEGQIFQPWPNSAKVNLKNVHPNQGVLISSPANTLYLLGCYPRRLHAYRNCQVETTSYKPIFFRGSESFTYIISFSTYSSLKKVERQGLPPLNDSCQVPSHMRYESAMILNRSKNQPTCQREELYSS